MHYAIYNIYNLPLHYSIHNIESSIIICYIFHTSTLKGKKKPDVIDLVESRSFN